MFFFFQAEDGIRDSSVTGVQTCALPIYPRLAAAGNSMVVRVVGSGQAWVGLTDSDDVAAGIREGLPLAPLPMTEATLLIPNTVAVVRRAPHPAARQQLFEYLQRREAADQLVAAHGSERPSTR